MRDEEKRQIGEQVEPGGREKAPGRLELLQRFINTHNHDFPPDWDRIRDGREARAWLHEKGLTGSRQRITDDDAERLRQLREAIRALVVANQARKPAPAAAALVRSAGRSAELTVEVDDRGRTTLATHRPGFDGVVATLLGILHEAQLSGEWNRLKGCRRCGYAFYDRSKNRSAAWCSMSICGNRTKNRAYYRRQRDSAG